MKKSLVEQIAKEAIDNSIKETMGDEVKIKNFVSTNLKSMLQDLINQMMISDREIFLKNNPDFGHGFYPRNLDTALGKLSLDVPRTRELNFRPFILPEKYKRSEQSYTNLLEALIVNGYSPAKLRILLQEMGLGYSKSEVENIIEELKNRYYCFVQKELPADVFVAYIDGYRTEMRDKEQRKVKTITIYTVIGIDINWNKNLYGFYIHTGVENKGNWLKTFNDLISRGLKRISLIVSDDFPGLIDAISEMFPYTDHQLCITHFKRNITKNMSKQDGKEFKNNFDSIKSLGNYEHALEKFEKLILAYKDNYKHFSSLIWTKRCHYLNFLKYPEPLRKYIYTTNVSENFNSRIETIRNRLNGFFQSEEILGINIILQLDRLKKGKWKKVHPYFKANEYELLQIHRGKFINYSTNSDVDVNSALEEMNSLADKMAG